MDGAVGCQEDIYWLLKFYLSVNLLLADKVTTNFLQNLDAVLFRHLEVEQHKVNRPNHDFIRFFTRGLRYRVDTFLNQSFYFVNYFLSVYTVSTFFMNA